MVHEDPLEVEKPSGLVHVLAEDPDVVVGHAKDLDLVVQVRRDGGEPGPCAVSLPLAIGPLAVAVPGAVVTEIRHSWANLRGKDGTNHQQQQEAVKAVH